MCRLRINMKYKSILKNSETSKCHKVCSEKCRRMKITDTATPRHFIFMIAIDGKLTVTLLFVISVLHPDYNLQVINPLENSNFII